MCLCDLKPKIWQFLKMKENYKGFTQFLNEDWISDFAFIESFFRHINKLNSKQMRKGIFAH